MGSDVDVVSSVVGSTVAVADSGVFVGCADVEGSGRVVSAIFGNAVVGSHSGEKLRPMVVAGCSVWGSPGAR